LINQNQKPQAAGIAADVSEDSDHCPVCRSHAIGSDMRNREVCVNCGSNFIIAEDFQATPGQAIREANTGTRETGFKPGTWLKGKTFAAESLGEVI
jgi:hypothetical protein